MANTLPCSSLGGGPCLGKSTFRGKKLAFGGGPAGRRTDKAAPCPVSVTASSTTQLKLPLSHVEASARALEQLKQSKTINSECIPDMQWHRRILYATELYLLSAGLCTTLHVLGLRACCPHKRYRVGCLAVESNTRAYKTLVFTSMAVMWSFRNLVGPRNSRTSTLT